MALKDTWINRANGVDDVDAEDINNVAKAVIELEKKSDQFRIPTVVQTTGDSETAVMSQKSVTDELNQLSEEIAYAGETIGSNTQTLSKNIIDIGEDVAGYIDGDGNLQKSASWVAKKIPASEIGVITRAILYSNNLSFYAIGFYSSEAISSDTFIGGVRFTSANRENCFELINIPQNAVMVVITNRIATSSNYTIEATSRNIYEELEIDNQKIWNEITSKLTLDDAHNILKGMVTGTGDFSSTMSWKSYMFDIGDLNCQFVSAKLYSNNLSALSISFFDDLKIDSKHFISGIAPQEITDNLITFSNVPVPNGTKMIVVSTRVASGTESEAEIVVNGVLLLSEKLGSDNIDYTHYKGQLKAKFENPGFANDFTVVGDELWGSYNEGIIVRYKLTKMGLLNVGTINTDFGHWNSVDYNPQNDCLIFGNGGNDYETNDNWFAIVKNPLALGTSATLAENAIIYSVDIGYKVQAVWGDNNLGLNNMVYLLSNNGQTLTKVLLGLDNGNFDGTFSTLESVQLDRPYFVGGCKFWGDTLYIGYADNTYKLAELSLTDNTVKVIHKHYYHEDGTELIGTTQGIHIDNKYLWVNINSTNPVNHYLLQYYR